MFTIFLFAGLLFLTDFGLLEFIGAIFTPIMRPIFGLPGRASIDCIASWVGDGTIDVTLTNKQYEDGYYNKKEATIIATTFSPVSITFSLVVMGQVGLTYLFGRYYQGNIMDMSERVPEGYTNVSWGLELAVAKAKKTDYFINYRISSTYHIYVNAIT